MENEPIIVLQSTFQGLLEQVLAFLPSLIGAIIILIVGIFVAWALRIVIEKIVGALKVDALLERFDVTSSLKKVGIKLHVGKLLGWIAKWFVLILFFMVAAETLGWSQVTVFLQDVLAYLPDAFIAVIILLVGMLLGSFVYDVVNTAVSAAKLGGAAILAGICKWAIVVFAFIAALQQLDIAQELLQTLTTGLVAMLALAGGLAFGLGGQSHAKHVLDKLKSDISQE